MRFGHVRGAAGFSLIETLLAAGILITTLASLAQLIVWSASRARDAGSRSRALAVAQGKLEELRALDWSIDLNGMPVSDPGLAASPSGALDANTSRYVESLDGAGRVIDTKGALVIRRWAVTPIDGGPLDSIALTVCVFRAPAIAVPRRGAELCLSTARVRQP